MPDWLQNIINALFMFIDGIVYGLIYILYKLIICLANIQIFDSGTFSDFATRIYAFLGIFMLFRLGFSVLQYLIDPDKATDKSVGAGKLMKNCIISLVLLVITPYAFSGLYKLQSLILSDNVLGNLVFGSDVVYSGDGKDGSHTLENMATDTQFLLFGSFFQVNTDVDTDIAEKCKNTKVLGSLSMAQEVDCMQALTTEMEKEGVRINDFYYTGSEANPEDTRNFRSFKSIVNIKYEDEYLFNYMPIISTVAGILVVYMLITFCIDIAIRVFYLAFLQLISPIPILSYMDPKQTFSSGIFSNWLKEVGKTYISVFIRLATIFLAMYFIQMVSNSIFGIGDNGLSYGDDNSGICEGCGEMNMWIYVLLIIGAFLFAKKVPQYIETIFGFKSDGGMFKSPFAKMQESGLLTGTVGAIGAGITGGIAGAAAAGMTAKVHGQSSVGQGLLGAGKGLVGGAWKGRKWDGKSAGSMLNYGFRTSGDIARYQGAKVGTSMRQRAGAMGREFIGAPPKADVINERVAAAKEFNDTFGRVESGIMSKLKKYGVGDFDPEKGKIKDESIHNQIRDYNMLRTKLEAARARGDYATINAIEEGTYKEYRDVLDSNGQYVLDQNGNRVQEVSFSMEQMMADHGIDGSRFDDLEDNAKDILYQALTKKQKDSDGNEVYIISQDDDIQRIVAERDSMKKMYDDYKSYDEFKGEIKLDGSFDDLKDSNKAVETRRIQTESGSDYKDQGRLKKAIEANRTFDWMRK